MLCIEKTMWVIDSAQVSDLWKTDPNTVFNEHLPRKTCYPKIFLSSKMLSLSKLLSMDLFSSNVIKAFTYFFGLLLVLIDLVRKNREYQVTGMNKYMLFKLMWRLMLWVRIMFMYVYELHTSFIHEIIKQRSRYSMFMILLLWNQVWNFQILFVEYNGKKMLTQQNPFEELF